IESLATTPLNSVVAADFNGDGFIDLATVSGVAAPTGTLSIMLGNGDGTFRAPINYAIGGHPRGVAAGDLNGDGQADVVVSSEKARNIVVFLGNGDGTLQPGLAYAANSVPRGIAIADVDGDGHQDVLAATFARDVKVFLGNGDGTL